MTTATMTDARSWDDAATWERHLRALMAKLGTWEIAYRNRDLSDWLTERSADYAAYRLDRDMHERYEADERRLHAEGGGDAAPWRYCRCSNCGAVNLDPIIRTSEEAPV